MLIVIGASVTPSCGAHSCFDHMFVSRLFILILYLVLASSFAGRVQLHSLHIVVVFVNCGPQHRYPRLPQSNRFAELHHHLLTIGHGISITMTVADRASGLVSLAQRQADRLLSPSTRREAWDKTLDFASRRPAVFVRPASHNVP